MASSYKEVVGDGATTIYSFDFPYLNIEHVKVYVDGVEVSYTASSQYILTLDAAPTDGSYVLIKRETPVEPLYDFTDSETLTGDELNAAIRQSVYIAEEAIDGVDVAVSLADAVKLSKEYATRQEIVDTGSSVWTDGDVVLIPSEGLSYTRQDGATVIADMPGWVTTDPDVIDVRHHGVVFDGVTDAVPGLNSALAEALSRGQAVGGDRYYPKLLIEGEELHFGQPWDIEAVMGTFQRLQVECNTVISYSGMTRADAIIKHMPATAVAFRFKWDGDWSIQADNSATDPRLFQFKKLSTESRITGGNVPGLGNVLAEIETADNGHINIRTTGGIDGNLMEWTLTDVYLQTTGTSFQFVTSAGANAPVGTLDAALVGRKLGVPTNDVEWIEIATINGDGNGGTLVSAPSSDLTGNNNIASFGVARVTGTSGSAVLQVQTDVVTSDWVGSSIIIRDGATWGDLYTNIVSVDAVANTLTVEHALGVDVTDGPVYTNGYVWIGEQGVEPAGAVKTNEWEIGGVCEKTGGVPVACFGGQGIDLAMKKWHGRGTGLRAWGAAGPIMLLCDVSGGVKVSGQVDQVILGDGEAMLRAVGPSARVDANFLRLGNKSQSASYLFIGVTDPDDSVVSFRAGSCFAGPSLNMITFSDDNNRKVLHGWDVPYDITAVDDLYLPVANGRYPTFTLSSDDVVKLGTWQEHGIYNILTEHGTNNLFALVGARFGFSQSAEKYEMFVGSETNVIVRDQSIDDYLTSQGTANTLTICISNDGIVLHNDGVGNNLTTVVSMSPTSN